MKNNKITRQRCLTKARELQANYRWKLMTAEELSEVVMDKLNCEPISELQPLLIATYAGLALYPALIGQQGPSQREQAFHELASFLHRLLCKRWPSLIESATDIIQATLERVLKQIHSCHRPETCLGFAATKLRTEVQKEFRQLAREQKIDSIDELDEQGREPSTPSELESKLSREMLQDMLQGYQQTNPRAAKQLEAVRLRYCEELTVEETAERMGMSSRNVSVLTSRGLRFLREHKDEFIF